MLLFRYSSSALAVRWPARPRPNTCCTRRRRTHPSAQCLANRIRYAFARVQRWGQGLRWSNRGQSLPSIKTRIFHPSFCFLQQNKHKILFEYQELHLPYLPDNTKTLVSPLPSSVFPLTVLSSDHRASVRRHGRRPLVVAVAARFARAADGLGRTRAAPHLLSDLHVGLRLRYLF